MKCKYKINKTKGRKNIDKATNPDVRVIRVKHNPAKLQAKYERTLTAVIACS